MQKSSVQSFSVDVQAVSALVDSCGLSSGSDGSEGNMVCLRAAKTTPCLQAGWHLHCSLGTVPDLHCPPNSCLDAIKLVWTKTRSFEQLDRHMSALMPFVC